MEGGIRLFSDEFKQNVDKDREQVSHDHRALYLNAFAGRNADDNPRDQQPTPYSSRIWIDIRNSFKRWISERTRRRLRRRRASAPRCDHAKDGADGAAADAEDLSEVLAIPSSEGESMSARSDAEADAVLQQRLLAECTPPSSSSAVKIGHCDDVSAPPGLTPSFDTIDRTERDSMWAEAKAEKDDANDEAKAEAKDENDEKDEVTDEKDEVKDEIAGAAATVENSPRAAEAAKRRWPTQLQARRKARASQRPPMTEKQGLREFRGQLGLRTGESEEDSEDDIAANPEATSSTGERLGRSSTERFATACAEAETRHAAWVQLNGSNEAARAACEETYAMRQPSDGSLKWPPGLSPQSSQWEWHDGYGWMDKWAIEGAIEWTNVSVKIPISESQVRYFQCEKTGQMKHDLKQNPVGVNVPVWGWMFRRYVYTEEGNYLHVYAFFSHPDANPRTPGKLAGGKKKNYYSKQARDLGNAGGAGNGQNQRNVAGRAREFNKNQGHKGASNSAVHSDVPS